MYLCVRLLQVCPICAALPGGDPNHVTDDFAAHLALEHRGPREFVSFPLAQMVTQFTLSVLVGLVDNHKNYLCCCNVLQYCRTTKLKTHRIVVIRSALSYIRSKTNMGVRATNWM